MSRIGKKPVNIPEDVKIKVEGGIITVEGPKGKLSRSVSPRITLEVKENQLIVTRATDAKTDKALHGLYRALIFNMIEGVTKGYIKELEIVGVGFKAQMQGKDLTMQLGFSHPVVFPAPEGITLETPKQTQISIKGIDKEKVGEVAHQIRSIRPPEPYKGKGIRFLGEHIKKKVGKAQATTK